MHKTKPSPDLDQKIISLYSDGKDTYEVALELNCSQTFVINTLKRHCITRRTTQHYTRKYITNEKFFDSVDTEDKAYFLGLMYADGNNYVKGVHSYEISIKLQERDKVILEKFRDLISPQTELKLILDKKIEKYYIRLKVNSKKISEQLCNLGCLPKKSLILQFPDCIPNHLINHFLRGYSDGDGSIYNKKPNKTDYINYGWNFISTEKFCTVAQSIIENNLSIHCSKNLCTPKRNKITTTLSVGGNLQVEKVLDWLYQDATIFLPRKYEKYLEFKQYLKI